MSVNHLQSARHRFLLYCVLILSSAISLRIYHLSEKSLWLDEAIAANISRGRIAETLTLTRALHSAPIVHPLVLQATERVSTQPLALRFPSLLASILAVGIMLCLVTVPSIDRRTAMLSALMLAVSASQIRYAQEVREYSLSVLFAALFTYCFLLMASEEESHVPVALYALLFVAPLIQYGLALFGGGIVASLFVLALTKPDRTHRLLVVRAVALLVAGSVMSFFLTLRYQWGDKASYLQGNYFTPGSGLLRFIWSSSYSLLCFTLPGQLGALISLLAIVFYLVAIARARILPPIVVLTFCSIGSVLACSILRLYPYGGIRQCLYLSPVLCLFASESLVRVADRFSGMMRRIVFVLIVCIVVLSGTMQIRSDKPYAEAEDIQSVLIRLHDLIALQDQAYVYSGAVPGVDFYWKGHDPRFIYGDFHRETPEKYLSELKANVLPETKKLWVMFSHIYRDEDSKILEQLSSDWEIQPILTAKASALYLAARKNAAECWSCSAAGSTNAGHTHDSFYEWAMRNSVRPTQ